MFCELMLDDLDALFTHQYGNYIVMHVVSVPTDHPHRPSADRACLQLVRNVCSGKLVHAATSKYGSHIVEQLLKKHGFVEGNLLLIKHVFEDPTTLTTLCHDLFGNYVVQAAFVCISTLPPTTSPAELATVTSTPETANILLLSLWCFQRVAMSSEGSQFKPNILKHASVCVRDFTDRSPMLNRGTPPQVALGRPVFAGPPMHQPASPPMTLLTTSLRAETPHSDSEKGSSLNTPKHQLSPSGGGRSTTSAKAVFAPEPLL